MEFCVFLNCMPVAALVVQLVCDIQNLIKLIMSFGSIFSFLSVSAEESLFAAVPDGLNDKIQSFH